MYVGRQDGSSRSCSSRTGVGSSSGIAAGSRKRGGSPVRSRMPRSHRRRSIQSTGTPARRGSSPARPTSSSMVPGEAATAAASPLSRKIPKTRRWTNSSQRPAERMNVAVNGALTRAGRIAARSRAIPSAAATSMTPPNAMMCAVPPVRLRPERVPDVEEVEPLRRLLADEALEHGHPRPERVLFPAAPDLHGLEHLEDVAPVALERAEGRHDRDGGGARELEGTDRERRRAAEERHRHVAAVAEGAVALEPDRLTAPQRRQQRQRDRRRGAGHEAEAAAVAAQPALEDRRLLHRDHDVGLARGMLSQDAPGQLPVADVRRERDDRAVKAFEAVDADALDGADVRAEPLWMAARRDEVAEAHGELAEDADGQLVELSAGRTGHDRHRLADDGALARQERLREVPDTASQPEAHPTGQPAQRRGQPVELRAIVRMRVPARLRSPSHRSLFRGGGPSRLAIVQKTECSLTSPGVRDKVG